MNGDAFKRARPGEKMIVSATAWNACLDAAEAHRRGQPANGGGPVQFRQADIVLVKNSSGTNVDRFGVLGIDGVIITPTASEIEFQQQVTIRGITPDAAVHAGKFVICLDPIANGQIGRAWIAGVCQVRVRIVDTTHRFCDVKNADPFQLQSSSIGTARILYKESAGDGEGPPPTIWCIVRIGDDSGPVLRIGKYGGGSIWAKNTLATITLYEAGTPPNETAGGSPPHPGAPGAPTGIANVVNHWGPVSPNKWVGVMPGANGHHYLVVAEC